MKLKQTPPAITKELLFDDFYRATKEAIQDLEVQFGIAGVLHQVLGHTEDESEAKEKLRSSPAWVTLSTLYEFAMDGAIAGVDPIDIVMGGADVLKLVTTETSGPSPEWDQIVAMGDGRHALDEGQDVPEGKVALLARVDLRTVRNAVSTGELVSFKSNQLTYIENAAARRWLRGRKGFRPTVTASGADGLRLEDLKNPAQFGAFLVAQRRRIGSENIQNKLVVFHPSVDTKALSQLEGGVFALPLDAVFPIADFYQLGRNCFLECVMRIFFADELRILLAEIAKVAVKK